MSTCFAHRGSGGHASDRGELRVEADRQGSISRTSNPASGERDSGDRRPRSRGDSAPPASQDAGSEGPGLFRGQCGKGRLEPARRLVCDWLQLRELRQADHDLRVERLDHRAVAVLPDDDVAGE